MKLSQFIKRAEELIGAYGDGEVRYYFGQNCYRDVREIFYIKEPNKYSKTSSPDRKFKKPFYEIEIIN